LGKSVIKKESGKKIFRVQDIQYVLPIATVVGYFAVYSYEWGYCSFLKIPSSFIQISLLNLLSAAIVAIPLMIHIFSKMLFLSTDVLFMIFANSFFVSSALVIKYSYPPMKIDEIIALCFLYLLGILRGAGVFRKISIKIFRVDEKKAEEGPTYRRMPPIVMDIVVLSLIGMITLINSGKILAALKHNYLVIKTEPELVILRKYSDKLICSGYDKETRMIEPGFFIKSIDQISQAGIMIIDEEIGTLKPKLREKTVEKEVKEKTK
jgi:hypothetical protein